MSTTLEARIDSLARRVTLLERGGAPPPAGAIGTILAAVSRHFGVTLAMLLSESRAAHVSLARHTGMALARELHGYSLGRLGQVFGRDHTSVVHALRRIAALRATDPGFAAQFDALLEILTQKEEG